MKTGGNAPRRPPAWLPACGATLFYFAAAIALTWPLATSLTRSIPSDMGDPVLNTWILAWSADHVRRFFAGELGAFSGYWNANIFHPSPLALAYSEHLFAQAVQIWPLYALTRNPVLCYNVIFLSTFVLSGLGMFLLVQELTGSRTAALVAGLVFAFTPYRLPQFSHVQVLSAQWMPFVVYGLHRHFESDRLRPLLGAGLALLAQNLSCGYYLLYFTPVVAGYVLFELARRRRWIDGRLLLRLAVVAVTVAVLTWPFVGPYLELRALGFPPRPVEEVRRFSADLQSYLMVQPSQWLWGGRLKAYYRPEGELFQGFVPMGLALLAVVWLLVSTRPDRLFPATAPFWRRWIAAPAAAFAALNAAAALVIVFRGGIIERVAGVTLRVTRPGGAVLRAALGFAALAWLSPGVRRWVAAASRTDIAFFVAVLVMATLLSFGPSITNGGRLTVPTAPYRWLYDVVPGFDGLRVPARLAMLVAMALSVLTGLGLARLQRRWRYGGAAALACGALFLAETGAAPIALNAPLPTADLEPPPPTLYNSGRIPTVYEKVADLPKASVIIELPVGSPAWDVRYMFYSTFHWRRLVNGFSGGLPARYARDMAAISRMFQDPDAAWTYLIDTGATHAIVHLTAYDISEGQLVADWLRNRGASELGRFGDEVLLALPPRER